VKYGTELDCCPKCTGVWFDKEELEAVLRVAAKELAIPNGAEETERLCPACSVPLHTFIYPQTLVRVDMCRRCSGLWLDGGEFKEIATVRRKLEAKGTLEEYAPPVGIKGALLRLIDAALESLRPPS